MNIPSIEQLTREERGEQDAAAIGAFYKRLIGDGVPADLSERMTYEYAIHLYLSARMQQGAQLSVKPTKKEPKP